MTAELDWETAMADFAARAGRRLEGAPAQQVLRWAADTFGEGLVVTTSMQDAVLVHLASQARPGVDVVFVDTGYHFAETLGLRAAVAAAYPVNVIDVHPENTVAEQDAALGARLHDRDPDRCCALRKVQPLGRALRGYRAWATGLRRAEAPTRRHARPVEWDAHRGLVKVNPLVAWTDADVDDYIERHGVLVNLLRADGYPSIGCAPCTRRVLPGGGARDGRWAGHAKVECGLHGIPERRTPDQ